MKQAIAKLRYLRMAPRKVRLVADLIRNLSYEEAQVQLMFSKKRAAKAILKLLKSAFANAKNKKLNLEKLYVKEIRVDQGPRLVRYWPRARGAVNKIEKKMSHITLILEEGEKEAKIKYKIKEKEKKNKEAKKKKTESKDQKKEKEEKLKEVGKEKEKVTQKIFKRKSV